MATPADGAESTDRPSLLYISPVYPGTTGNGLSMRAGAFLQALASHYRVTLLILSARPEPPEPSGPIFETCCESVRVIASRSPSSRFASVRSRFDKRPDLMQLYARDIDGIDLQFAGKRFDAIHVFRLYTAPVALAVAKQASGRPRLHLDLDDVESVARRRIAALAGQMGDEALADLEGTQASRFAKAERQYLPRFDRVYVASRPDIELLRPLVRGELRVAPNVIRLPESPLEPRTTHPFTFLFIGTLGFYPNADAVAFFTREVLPKLRAMADRPFIVRIVGGGLPEGLYPLARAPELRLVGEVPDLSGEYADADAVIVPIRAGGGTRIKALEAFSYRRAVVGTSIGLEGIEVTPEEDCLIGDTAGDFAKQCLRLLEDSDLRERLAGNAFNLVAGRYSLDNLREAVRPAP